MKLALCLVSSPAQVDSLRRLSNCIRVKERLILIVVRFDISAQGFAAEEQYAQELSKLHGVIFIPEKVYAIIFRTARNLKLSTFRVINRFASRYLIAILGNIIGIYSKNFDLQGENLEIILVDDGLVTIDIANKILKSQAFPRVRIFTKYDTYLQDLGVRYPCKYEISEFSPAQSKLSSKALGIFGSPLVETAALDFSSYEDLVLSVMEKLGYSSAIYFMHRRESPKFQNHKILEVQSQKANSLELLHSSDFIPKEFWACGSSALIDLFVSDTANIFSYYFTSLDLEKVQHRDLVDLGIPYANIYNHYSASGFAEIEYQIREGSA